MSTIIPPWNKQKWRKNKVKSDKYKESKESKESKVEDTEFLKFLELIQSINAPNKNTKVEVSILRPGDMNRILGNNPKQFNNIKSNPFMPLELSLKSLFAKAPQNKQNSHIKKNNKFILDSNKKYDEFGFDIKTIDDIIKLGQLYKSNHNYPIDLEKINNIIPALTKLKNVIGMNNVKKTVVNQIIYFISGIHDDNNMLHTIITGPPGVGKTMLGHIIGDIYFHLGVISGNDKDDYIFKKVRRNDLVGEYMGHTAIKTQNVINECIGGVLFIDEAYSLGNTGKKDIYSKECIDTLNQNLTENKGNFVCIIAGYENALEDCFFSVNEGLRRRFPFKYNIDKYTKLELFHILLSFIKTTEWRLNQDVEFDDLKDFIADNYDNFPNFGGDIENYIFSVKLAHSKRIIGKSPALKKKLTLIDFRNGMEIFLDGRKKENNIEYLNMYL